MKLKKIRIKFLLIITFLLMSILPISFMVVWVEKIALEVEIHSAEEKHLLLAKNITYSLNRYASEVKTVFRSSSNAMTQGILRSEDTLMLMKSLGIKVIAEYNEAEHRWSSILGDKKYLPYNISKKLDDLMPKITEGQIFFCGVSLNALNEPTVYLVRKVSENSFYIGSLETKFIQDIQQNVSFGILGHAAIVDHKGVIIAHPKETWRKAMKSLAILAPVQKMMAKKNGVIKFFSPALQTDMIAGYAVVPEVGWGVMVPQPISELMNKADYVKSLAHLAAAYGMVLALCISWIVAGIIYRPIRELKNSAALVADGGHASIAVKRFFWIDEISEIVTSFNKMALEVSKSRMELEESNTISQNQSPRITNRNDTDP